MRLSRSGALRDFQMAESLSTGVFVTVATSKVNEAEVPNSKPEEISNPKISKELRAFPPRPGSLGFGMGTFSHGVCNQAALSTQTNYIAAETYQLMDTKDFT